ncbi:hypothetical protein [Candidatus Poriferisodalis sp.]|uniref:hypothetical protein n=1 Tax=Candidatus Poriferisodalis sp. TaxID=3101277 RepID=UPI003B02BAA9
MVAAALLAAGCTADDEPQADMPDASVVETEEVTAATAAPATAPSATTSTPASAEAEPEPAGDDVDSEPAGDDVEAEPAGDDAEAQPDEAAVSDGPPPKSDAAAYTRFVVSQAIDLYDSAGLDALLDEVNSPDSVDGQWYVFVVDSDDTIIGHYDDNRLGADLNGWIGTDVNGYVFGAEMLTATQAGKWVPYVFSNPASGALGDEDSFEFKNAWVVRHDGLLFGSGWYVDTEEFAPQLFSEAAEHFRSGGLEAFLEFSTEPGGVNTGLIPLAEYYNRTVTLDGLFTGIAAAPDGTILAHIDPGLIDTDIEDLLGPAVRNATAEGGWITADDNPEGIGPETMRMWLIDVDGTLIGGGWYRLAEGG